MSSYFFILIHNFNKFSTYNVTVAWNHNQYKDLIFNKEGATFEETYIYFFVLSLCTSLYGCSRMGTNIYNGLNNKRLETKSTGLDNTCINWFLYLTMNLEHLILMIN